MRITRHPLLACAPIVLAAAISAQQPAVTPDSPVDSATLHQWLHGSDLRLVAWAADFARRRNDTALLAEMPAALENIAMPPPYGGDQTASDRRDAILSILDALIQTNTPVPAPTIEAFAQSFPEEAVILSSRLPIGDSRMTLQSWIQSGDGWPGPTLARVAAMLLAKHPEGAYLFRDQQRLSFVASIIDASEEDLHITIRSSGQWGSGFGGGACGDSLASAPPPGWPIAHAYFLEENNQQSGDLVIVDLGGDVITARRREAHGGWGSCFGIEGLNAVTRHRLIAYWLGMHAIDMPWQPREDRTIVWTDEAAYQRQLGAIIEDERRKLAQTVAALRRRGLLGADEPAMPRLVVSIDCDISPCPLPAPDQSAHLRQAEHNLSAPPIRAARGCEPRADG